MAKKKIFKLKKEDKELLTSFIISLGAILLVFATLVLILRILVKKEEEVNTNDPIPVENSGELIISDDVDSEIEEYFGFDKVGWPDYLPDLVPKFKYGEVRTDSDDDKSSPYTLLVFKLKEDSFTKYKTELESENWSILSEEENQFTAKKDGVTISFTISEKNAVLTITN